MSLLSRTFLLQVDRSDQRLHLYYNQEPVPLLTRLLTALLMPLVAAALQLHAGTPLDFHWMVGLVIYFGGFWTMNRYELVVEKGGSEASFRLRPLLLDLLAPSPQQLSRATALKSYGSLSFVKVERADSASEWVFIPPALSPTSSRMWPHEEVCDFLVPGTSGPDSDSLRED